MITAAADPRTVAGELARRLSWSVDELGAHQRHALRALVRVAITASPFYRRTLGPDAVDAPLEQLPTVSKAALMEHFDEVVTEPRLRLSSLEAHLSGPRAGRRYAGHVVCTTSGSTGRRGVFVYSPAELAVWVAALLRSMAVFGVIPETRMLGIGAPSGVHISRHLVAGLSVGSPDLPQVTVATPLPELVAALNRVQPEAMPSYASVHAALAEEQLAGRLHITPRIVACTGEVLTDTARAQIEAAWAIRPYELYATTEIPVLASSCPRHVGQHLWEDLALVEVVDEHDRPVPPGVPGHKVLVTSLVNRVQPLIRYELCDTATLAADPNPTGMPFRRLAAVNGRSDDILRLPAPGGGTVAVHPSHLRQPFAAVPDVVQFQIVQHAEGLSVWIVPRAGAAAGTTRRIKDALRQSLVRAGAVAPPITVNVVTDIAREADNNHKYMTIKSLLAPRREPHYGAEPER